MNPKELSAKARAMVKGGGVLLDVRTPQEFATGHLDGATNIPLQDLPRRVSELGAPTTPVVVHCAAGIRSRMAVQVLKGAGFTDILDIGTMAAY